MTELLLKELEALLKERIKNTQREIDESEGNEYKVNWGSLIAYEAMLDDIQARLGNGVLDVKGWGNE